MYDSLAALTSAINLQASEAIAEVSATIADDRPIVTDDLEHLDEPDAYSTLSDVAFSPAWKYLVEVQAIPVLQSPSRISTHKLMKNTLNNVNFTKIVWGTM